VFDDAGYAAGPIQERLGTHDRALAQTPDRPVYLRRIGEDDALAVLVLLFMLDAPVATDVLERQLGRDSVELFERIGLVVLENGLVHGTVRLVPHEHLLIASDRYTEDFPDHVAAVHGPSATMAHLTVRRPVARALDVGTGNGIQALLAAASADRVVATDINERALAFATFNATLNGVENVEFRAGSFFEPVAGEQFDLIVTNPPYVISPESKFLFRDSGMRGDSVSEQVARTLPEHLAEGGFGTVMLSWVQTGEDATIRPAGWFEGCGCDALVLHTGTDEPLSIAAQWNRDLRSDPDEYAAAIDRWVDYFSQEGIGLIAFGCAVLRRRSGTNWTKSVRMPSRALEPAGAQIEAMFAAQDFLAGLADERLLLDERFKVSERVRVEQELLLADDGWALRDSSIGIATGMRFTAGLDEVTTALVLGLDGTRTIRDALPAPDAAHSQQELEEIGVRVVRQMLELGFLQRA
jgi:methylase of polypeptide subunit release factors